MADKLTTNERDHAARQGWRLVTVYDTRGYFADAVAPTENSPHTSAAHAFQFVWSQAKAGDLVCRRALSLISASELAGKSKTVKKGRK